MNIVIVGHVDHGKSTLIGRLLYDTDSLPEGVFESVKAACESHGAEVEFAYLLDSLEEERKQNVTIDTTQMFFKTLKRDYTIIDAPGHKEFLKNMITGSSLAEAGILIVAGDEGIQEQTKRHAYILSLLGLKQVIVVVNKMDSIGYDKAKFEEIKTGISDFLKKLNIPVEHIIAISAMKGDNIVEKSENLPWYKGLTLLAALDVFETKKSEEDKPLRLPVQDVYKRGDKRILAGTMESGIIKEGQEVKLFPSASTTKVKSIELWNDNSSKACAGQSIGVTLTDPLFTDRGEIICSGEDPKVKEQFEASVFCMSKKPIKVGERLILKCTTQEVDCVLKKIVGKIDSSTLEKIEGHQDELQELEVGDVQIKTDKPLVIENFNNIPGLGRFVIVRDEDTIAGGILHDN